LLKFIVVVRRKIDWTPERFREYFVGVHAPMVVKMPGLRRYRLNFAAPDAKRAGPGWDCVAELFFDARETMEAAWASAEGKAASADVAVFADMEWASWSVVDEIAVRD